FVLQLDERFSQQATDFFKLFEVFDSSNDNFFNHNSPYISSFINHYSYFQFNKIKIDSEFPSAKTLLTNKNNMDLDSITLCLKNYPEAFNETLFLLLKHYQYLLFQMKDFFSSLKRVKTYSRTTMGDNRLNDLMVIAVEKEEASNIDLQEAVNAFAHIKTRRYPLI
ncbi:zinc finger MYM-type protein 1-like, partial [Aphis craccivora]